MTIRAYAECYLGDAQQALGDYFDYVVNACGIQADKAAALLSQSDAGEQFGFGNPSIVAGMSGIELAQEVLGGSFVVADYPVVELDEGRTPEFWAGWALAYFQWESARTFSEIFRRIAFSEIVALYPPYHEMDVSQVVGALSDLWRERRGETRLKSIREARGLSQSQLANQAQVGLRSIQMYEQRVNDIDKAQAKTLWRMARVLGCAIDDLLEEPNS